MKFRILVFAMTFFASLTAYSHQAFAQASNSKNSKEFSRVDYKRDSAKNQSFSEYTNCSFRWWKKTPPYAQASTSMEEEQSTAINISLANLSQPHTITISTDAGTYLFGQISLDGRVVKRFAGNKTAMNLSPCLSKGKHTLQILGNYGPASSSVLVEISGPGTKVSQATAGNGKINHTLTVYVR